MLLEVILAGFGGYAALGLAFAIVFAFANGAARIDPAAREANLAFRLILIPGAVVFWPYLLWRWIQHSPPPEERSPHRKPMP